LQCIVPLPVDDRVATASNKGMVHVIGVATGALEREIDAHEEKVGWRALAALGGDIIVSGGDAGGKVATWNAASGERLGEAAAGSSIIALAVLDSGRFVAGTVNGDVVYYAHLVGRGLEATARIAGAHTHEVSGISVYRGQLATVSFDNTAAVWGVDSRKRLATFRGHTKFVISVDMNDRLVATASLDATVRVHRSAGDYSLIAVLDWLHTGWIRCVVLIGGDHILSASGDYTVCVTQRSHPALSSRTQS
jgi:WD40 repeat protein